MGASLMVRPGQRAIAVVVFFAAGRGTAFQTPLARRTAIGTLRRFRGHQVQVSGLRNAHPLILLHFTSRGKRRLGVRWPRTQFGTSEAMGKMFFDILGVFAEFEPRGTAKA